MCNYILSIFSFLTYFKCVWVFPLHVAVCTMCVWCLRRTEEGFGLAGTVFMDGCELPCRCLEIETWSSARTTNAFNHRTISPVSVF